MRRAGRGKQQAAGNPVADARAAAVAEQRTQPPGQTRVAAVEQDRDHQEGSAEHQELQGQRLAQIDELGKEGGVEKKRLGIGRVDHQPLKEEPPRGDLATLQFL